MSKGNVWSNHGELAGLRSNIYGFLSMIYSREPTPELIQNLSDGELKVALSDIGVEFDEIFDAGDQEELLDALVLEYTHLFLGPGGNQVPPFASVHSKAAKGGAPEFAPLLGEEAFAARDFYKEHGYEPLRAFKDSPDHIGVQLGFMRLLTQKEKDAWGKKKKQDALTWLETQVRFLKDHMGSWVPIFCEKVTRRANLTFYKSLLEVTAMFVESELDSLPTFITEVREIQ